MKCTPILLIIAAVAVFRCSNIKPDEQPFPLSLDKCPITFSIGDSWLYKETLAMPGISKFAAYPETLYAYSFFIVSKDTIIGSSTFHIIDGIDHEIGKDSIYRWLKRLAVHTSDSGLTSFTLKGSIDRVQSYPFKIRAVSNAYTISSIRSVLLQKLFSNAFYDTLIFSDFNYPIVFPLRINEPYIYRPKGDPLGNLYWMKKLAGLEYLSIYSGTFPVYKVEWLIEESLAANDISDNHPVYSYDWIGINGILRKVFVQKSNSMLDSLGDTLGFYDFYDTYELVGDKNIDPDTLVPWGKRSGS